MSNGKQAKVQKGANDFRRFIEESFPVKEVGEASAREKNIRHGYISTLHIWWSRKPLAVSRATAYAALTSVPVNAEEWQRKRDFIVQLSQWENSNNTTLLERARQEILEANKGIPPKVLDPFAGGGSYPLEALRLGCEAYSIDYNPVAVLIEKATLEYPLKFSGHVDSKNAKLSSDNSDTKAQQPPLFERSSESTSGNQLLDAVSFWGNWVLKEAEKEIGQYYTTENGNVPLAYYWVRTIPCPNPTCGQNIPLTSNWWLSIKKGKNVALFPEIKNGAIEFRIVSEEQKNWPSDFDPNKGSISRAVATCLVCGSVSDANNTRNYFKTGQNGQQLVVVISAKKGKEGKRYSLATNDDEQLYKDAAKQLAQKRNALFSEWGFDPVPDEEAPGTIASNAIGSRYSFNVFGDYFNDRQKLILITFLEKIRLAYDIIIRNNGVDTEFAQAIVTYLALALDRLADFGSTLCLLNPTGGRGVVHTFGYQGIAMSWDYAESNPFFPEAAGWKTACVKNEKWISHAAAIGNRAGIVSQNDATKLPFDDNYFDAVLTDPPYYDNVNYSVLSDYFYVWLKRSLGHLFPDLFSTPLSPKKGEIISDRYRQGGKEQAKVFFEQNIKAALIEIRRVLKPTGIAVIVYAHKSTAGWETIINALLDSGLVITSAWPINTEMQARLGAQESASLASSIYIVVRKMPRQPTGFYNDVRVELRQHLDTKLHRLWEEGIGGADFFIAAIGSAIEVFGKYEQVMDYEGNIVRADRLLEEVRTIATDYAVRQILHNGFAAEISGLTRLYVLWRWNYGEALVPFDEARKLAQSCGIDISEAWSKTGVIRKEKEFVRMLGPQGRKLEDLDDPLDLIDVLHKSLLLWEKGQRAEMVTALADRGFGRSEAFYRVAQAISETLPLESKEKKLLDGFLAGRERVQEEVEKEGRQEKLL